MLINRTCLWSTISEWEGEVANTITDVVKIKLGLTKILNAEPCHFDKVFIFQSLAKMSSKIKEKLLCFTPHTTKKRQDFFVLLGFCKQILHLSMLPPTIYQVAQSLRIWMRMRGSKCSAGSRDLRCSAN